MNSSFDAPLVLYSIGLALAVFFGISLLSIRRGNRIPNYILASLLFLISIAISRSILNHSKLIFKMPQLIGIARPLAFAYPPLFFLYVKSLVSIEFRLRKHLWHFVPFLFATFYSLPFLLQSGAVKAKYLISSQVNSQTSLRVPAILIVTQELIYIFLSLVALIRHSKKVKLHYSTLKKMSLTWIRNLIIAYFLVTAIFILIKISGETAGSIPLAPMAVVAFIYTLGYFGIRQPAVFLEMQSSQNSRKYEKSSLTPEKADQY